MSPAFFRQNLCLNKKIKFYYNIENLVKRRYIVKTSSERFYWKKPPLPMSNFLSRAMGKSSDGHMTREAAASRERDKYLSMSLSDKRKQYKCGDDYSTLDDIQTWEEYMKDNRDRLLKKRRKTTTIDVKSNINKKVSIWRGDITTLEIDAIVNAANNALLGGGGVDGAIHRGAGSSLKMECSTLNGCETGDAKITGGHKLPAKHVIHTVGPIGEQQGKLKSCYTKCLALVKENNLKSVAFPCISTGIYGYPNLPAAHIAIGIARKFLEDPDTASQIDRVIFCLFLPNDVDIYEELFQYYFPVDDTTDDKPKEAEEKQDMEEAESGTKKSESESKPSEETVIKGEGETNEAEEKEDKKLDTKDEPKGDIDTVKTNDENSEDTKVEMKEESVETDVKEDQGKRTATSAL